MSRAAVAKLFVCLFTVSLGAGCKAKPSEEACRDAIENARKIYGQSANAVGLDPKATIRSCQGSSTIESVECRRAAKTIADLDKCNAAGDAKSSGSAQPAADEAAPTE